MAVNLMQESGARHRAAFDVVLQNQFLVAQERCWMSQNATGISRTELAVLIEGKVRRTLGSPFRRALILNPIGRAQLMDGTIGNFSSSTSGDRNPYYWVLF